MPRSEKKYLLAVYGTLRKGYGNYASYLQTATYLGTVTTLEKYRLVVIDYPCLLPFNGEGHQIVVDLFEIDVSILMKIDALEEYPRVYQRKKIAMSNGAIAWIYFRNVDRQPPYLKVYTDQTKT
ncbi:gamma-glutamylcyclotransferase [Cyclobacteriaceae bacterium]|jgi:gamma-glutamylaminecyclotransferase|nr:gamma-glutamylcyclotransferase [Cyclobacteriaceae bacterium]MDC1369454.1 gamma-glutamylcyclotransferase [Cyclobacteriaceae bacterium]|tara:strand:+ start:87 stop:458 length:372 start_codon:yes stop_codon:yes gene_type:complete